MGTKRLVYVIRDVKTEHKLEISEHVNFTRSGMATLKILYAPYLSIQLPGSFMRRSETPTGAVCGAGYA